MRVEQAIHTSSASQGRSGYHIVARSSGITDEVARQIASRSPSNGALIVDPNNRASLNFFPIRNGLHVLSRTCLGPPEYSGRGENCLHTHALVLEAQQLATAHYQVAAIYRDALALGHLTYRPVEGPWLPVVALSDCYRGPRVLAPTLPIALAPHFKSTWAITEELAHNPSLHIRADVDRIALVEDLFSCLPTDLIREMSVSTSLVPSTSRGFRLTLTA
jgi:hypothetical protein